MFSLLIMKPNLFMLCIAKADHAQAPTIIELTGIPCLHVFILIFCE